MSIEDISKKALAIDAAEIRRPEDFFGTLQILVAKRLFWTEIAQWMQDNTEFYRSSTFWKKLYTEETDRRKPVSAK